MSDSGPQYAAELVVGLRAGNRRALARLLTEAENGSPAGREGLRLLFADTGRAHTVGITGSPGAGKSTVTNMLAKAYRAQDKTVAIVAVTSAGAQDDASNGSPESQSRPLGRSTARMRAPD